MDIRIGGKKIGEELLYRLHWIAIVQLVAAVEEPSLGVDDAGLHGGGACVDTEEGLPFVVEGISLRQLRPLMAPLELLQLFFGFEEGRDGGECLLCMIVLKLIHQIREGDGLIALGQRRPQSYEIQGVFGTNSLKVQGLVEGFAQGGEECQRAAQIYHLTGDRTTLCKACYGLVDHRLKN
ncbi:hypothetical protein DSECCO2_527600 [anaerobic digester metagenome]